VIFIAIGDTITQTILILARFLCAITQCQIAVSPFQESVSPFQESVAPFQESVAPFQMSVAPFQMSVAPFQESVAPFQESVEQCLKHSPCIHEEPMATELLLRVRALTPFCIIVTLPETLPSRQNPLLPLLNPLQFPGAVTIEKKGTGSIRWITLLLCLRKIANNAYKMSTEICI